MNSWLRRLGMAVWCITLGFVACSRGNCATAANTSAAPSPGTPATPAPPAIEKAFISFRIGTPQWLPDQRYRELLALFEKYKGVTDEITFFTSFTHPNLPLEEMKRRCEILAQRIVQARALGYRSGINVLSTMGHHEENLPNSLAGDYTPVTDIGGGVSRGSLCPNDPNLQDYVRQIYQLTAAANPDYIWVDDDVRLMGHMPVGLTCFCNHCLEVRFRHAAWRFMRTTSAGASVSVVTILGTTFTV
jgi:hypothetical protein